MTTTHKTTAETFAVGDRVHYHGWTDVYPATDAEARRIYARKNTTAFTIAFVLTQRADAIRNGKMTSEETTT